MNFVWVVKSIYIKQVDKKDFLCCRLSSYLNRLFNILLTLVYFKEKCILGVYVKIAF